MNTTVSPPALYLCSPVNAIVEGLYEQKIAFNELLQHGDFGLGTFDQLDGEMVLLDGEVFQIDSAGAVHRIGREAMTPFACVTFFRAVSEDDVAESLSWDAFQLRLDALMPSRNIFYAFRIDGKFDLIRARSVPRTENYRPLVDAAGTQSTFEFRQVRGTLAGFYTPAFMSSLNVPGIHLHFLSEDRTRGGHLLECRPAGVKVGVQFLSRLELSLPMSLDYLTLQFQRDVAADLHKAER